jgi:DNA-binding response OmpR family regulator
MFEPEQWEWRQRRILVVDDHLDHGHSLTDLLRTLGHYVDYAINGYAALRIAEKFRPEIVFLDMLLPDFDGSDLSLLLRLKLHPEPLRIVAISGHPEEDVRHRALRAGCDGFFLKPLNLRQVERLLA